METYSITIRNEKIWRFYNEHPNLDFENINLLFIFSFISSNIPLFLFHKHFSPCMDCTFYLGVSFVITFG